MLDDHLVQHRMLSTQYYIYAVRDWLSVEDLCVIAQPQGPNFLKDDRGSSECSSFSPNLQIDAALSIGMTWSGWASSQKSDNTTQVYDESCGISPREPMRCPRHSQVRSRSCWLAKGFSLPRGTLTLWPRKDLLAHRMIRSAYSQVSRKPSHNPHPTL